MDEKVKDIAGRIKGLREMSGFSLKEMAEAVSLSESDYREYEDGKVDFSFTFLHAAAKKLGVDITELIRGDAPNLSGYTIERAEEGLPVNRRAGFRYLHKASNFKNRKAEPFVVEVPFVENVDPKEIKLNTHSGQEMDFILEGQLTIVVDGHIEVLNPGDCIFYDSGRPHGMVASDGKMCKFIAIVF